jgi:hypothetical protein
MKTIMWLIRENENSDATNRIKVARNNLLAPFSMPESIKMNFYESPLTFLEIHSFRALCSPLLILTAVQYAQEGE